MIATLLPRVVLCGVLVLGALAGGGCQSTGPVERATHRVTWRAFRAQDNAPLATATSPAFGVNGSVEVRTDSVEPTDERPAFPKFTAHLARNALRPGTLELVTRAYVREVIRTKKGKRKVARRVIGGLLPIRSGETQEFNGPADPIRIEASLDGGGSVHPPK